jgi:F-type H+-transporting ATPase subunit delta
MVLSLILLQILTFAVIVGVLHFFFGSQLKSALNRLQVLHQESLEKEEVLNKEIERARVQCDAEISRSKEEAKAIVDQARATAERTLHEAQERAQNDVRKIMTEVSERARQIEEEVTRGVEERAIELAQELIKFTFGQQDLKVLHVQLIDELIEQCKKLDPGRLSSPASRAEVITSWPLTPEEEKKLREILFAKLGHELPVEERVDAGLILGLVIRLGGVVIDGSLKNRLMKAMRTMRQKGAPGDHAT